MNKDDIIDIIEDTIDDRIKYLTEFNNARQEYPHVVSYDFSTKIRIEELEHIRRELIREIE